MGRGMDLGKAPLVIVIIFIEMIVDGAILLAASAATTSLPYLFMSLKYTPSMAILTSTAYFYWILRGFGRRISRNLEWIAGPVILSAVA